MANCKSCNKKMGFEDKINAKKLGVCIACVRNGREANIEQDQEEVSIEEELGISIDEVMLTTEIALDLNITERIEIVTAECAFGMNIFKDLFAGVRDIVGGRSKAVQQTMRDSRRTVLYELKKEAHAVGANAVVGVDLDYVDLGSKGNMVMLVASGTAVLIEDE